MIYDQAAIEPIHNSPFTISLVLEVIVKSKMIWGLLLIAIVLAIVGVFYRDTVTAYVGGGRTQPNRSNPEAGADRQQQRQQQETSTVSIRPASDTAQVSAAGNIALASQQSIGLLVDGVITDIAVDVGDNVAAGDLLLALDTTELERAVRQAGLDLAIRQAQLDKLSEPPSPADVAAADANIASAKENLAEIKAGANATELAAAQAKLVAAQGRYQELLDGKSEAELTQLGAELHRSFIALEQAQEAYNEIAYRDDIGQSQQAMNLQEATIDYDVAKAAFELATESAARADLLDALSTIRDSEHQIAALSPTAAEIVAAEAQVVSAEAALAQLLSGPSDADVREAELNLAQAELNLEEANATLAGTQLVAPAAGTVLALEVEVGQKVAAGSSALSMADLTNLELSVNVAEVDIGKVTLNQPAEIAIDALPDQTIRGEVTRIAPTSQSDSGVVNYTVAIRLDPGDLVGVRPGMTAVATIADPTTAAAWLVPTNSLVEFEGETTVLVVRDGQRNRIEVTALSSQGEWTIVESPNLQGGDEVVGQVASFLNEESDRPRGPFGPRPR